MHSSSPRPILRAPFGALGARVAPALVAEVATGGPHSYVATEALAKLGPKATPALLAALSAAGNSGSRARLLWCLADVKDARAADAFVRALDDRDHLARDAALTGLDGLGKNQRAREGLLHALASGNHYDRSQAVAGLEKFGAAPEVRAALIRAVADRDRVVRRFALQALERLGPVSPETYLQCLQNAEPPERARIVRKLGEIGGAAAIPALQEIARYDLAVTARPEGARMRRAQQASSPALRLRSLARVALQQIAARTGLEASPPSTPEQPAGPNWSFQEVTAAAQCANEGIRWEAVGRLEYDFHTRETLALLRGAIERDPSPSVRTAAVCAMKGLFRKRKVGEPTAAFDPLVLPAEEAEGVFDFLLDLTRQGDEEIRYRALEAMRSLVQSTGVRACASFRRFPEYLAAACQLIEEDKRGRALELDDALPWDDTSLPHTGMLIVSEVANGAPEALTRLLAPDARARLVRRLVAGLGSNDPVEVIHCIDALGSLRERTAVPQLGACLHDQFPSYRHFAAEALARIGDPAALPALQRMAGNDVTPIDDVDLHKQTMHVEVLRETAREAIDAIRRAEQPR